VEFTLQNSLGLTILQSRGIFTRGYWYWLGAAALVGYILVFNILVTFALGYFEPLGRPQALVPEELLIEKVENRAAISKRDKSTLPSSVHASSAANGAGADGIQMGVIALGQESGVQETSVEVDDDVEREGHVQQKGMILPFEPLALTFHNVCYYVDMPSVSVF
jgi:hypothetical protein